MSRAARPPSKAALSAADVCCGWVPGGASALRRHSGAVRSSPCGWLREGKRRPAQPSAASLLLAGGIHAGHSDSSEQAEPHGRWHRHGLTASFGWWLCSFCMRKAFNCFYCSLGHFFTMWIVRKPLPEQFLVTCFQNNVRFQPLSHFKIAKAKHGQVLAFIVFGSHSSCPC